MNNGRPPHSAAVQRQLRKTFGIVVRCVRRIENARRRVAMKAVKKLAIGAVGLAALVGASAPAAAQYYPGYGYPYGGSGNVIGQVLNQVLNPYGSQYGYGQYGYGYGANPQLAVQQCTAAVQQRLAYNGGYGGYGAYGYTNAYSNARVLGITRVEQRSSTTTRVRGYATSGMAYGGYGAYGAQAPADLTFKCDIDYRGYVRDIDINRRY
jgi:hypothetical protein